MGQHMASLLVLPVEWRNTMKVLQDKCEPTLYEDLEALFLKDMGIPIADFFDSFDPKPLGVASLAQVHVGHHKPSGKLVAIKVSFSSRFKVISVDFGISCNILISQSSATLTWRW
jgi:aarF domain-containing kinase